MTEKQKGLVMEASTGEIVVMTSTGEFMKIPWQKKEIPLLGSEIEFEVPSLKQGFVHSRGFLALAASIVLFFFMFPSFWGYLFPGEHKVIAYVSIDINPSLELGLDKDGTVREARGLNEDGVKLLEKVEYKNLPAEKAIRNITRAAVNNQYLAGEKENKIIFTYSAVDEQNVNIEQESEIFGKLQKELTKEVNDELKKQRIEVQMEILEVSPQFHANAQELGISPGKYAVMLEAMKEGVDITVEDVKFSSVVKAIKDAGGNPGQIISQTKKEEKRLPELEKELKDKVTKGKKNNYREKGKDEADKVSGKENNRNSNKKKNKDKDKNSNRSKVTSKEDIDKNIKSNDNINKEKTRKGYVNKEDIERDENYQENDIKNTENNNKAQEDNEYTEYNEDNQDNQDNKDNEKQIINSRKRNIKDYRNVSPSINWQEVSLP